AQGGQDRVVVVRVDVAVHLVRDLAGIAVRNLTRDCGDQSKAEREGAEQQEEQNEARETELSNPAPAPVRSGRRITTSAAKQADDFSSGRSETASASARRLHRLSPP